MRKELLLAMPLLLVFAACSQENTPPDDPTHVENRENTANTADDQHNETVDPMGEQMDQLSFNEYELDLDFNGSDDNFEIEFKKRTDGTVDAEYKDQRKNINSKGEEAFNMLFPKLKDMNIDKETPEEDVISKSLEAFEIENDYKELDLEIVFNDGTKKEYKQNQ
ncbi:hypothetical protein DCC39_01945 [Pueribacillus theae]|uniref:YusW-like protein n=1 Tax=Pueribacillus theae TaxID=2171751 RepID=A0A2U1K776_9BACI|nr:YusW family protein [Pueribacillus theae]PWA13232.1 hypothetical protein DCC39_01945 [Pueribacillus theae]